jgi:hypothetical protein
MTTHMHGRICAMKRWFLAGWLALNLVIGQEILIIRDLNLIIGDTVTMTIQYSNETRDILLEEPSR